MSVTVDYNTQPADNTSMPPAIAGSFPVVGGYINIDVTQMLATALSSYTSGYISFRLYTPSTQTVYLCSGYSYGAAIPELIIQTTNAPKITVTSPALSPAYLYVNSGLQIIATATAIPANAANLTTQWSQVSGPGTATFSSPSLPSTTVTFSAPGDYVLQLAANDGVLQSSKTVAVTVLSVPTSTSPATGATSNLVMRLPLDETSGTIAHDDSGVSPANSGTLSYVSGSSNPVWSPTGGRIGGALSFSGSGTAGDRPGFERQSPRWHDADVGFPVVLREFDSDIIGQLCRADIQAKRRLSATSPMPWISGEGQRRRTVCISTLGTPVW